MTERAATKTFEPPKSPEALLSRPPVAFIIQGDWRGTGHRNQKAWDTMLSRCAVAAHLYHSTLYEDTARPLLVSFAAEHKPGQEAASTRIAYFLADFFQVAEKDIVVSPRSGNLTGDLTALHAFINRMRARGIQGPMAFITSDDLVTLVSREWQNHFQDHQIPHQQPNLSVLSPSSRVLKDIELNHNLPANLEKDIEHYTRIGQNGYTHSGPKVLLANLLAHSPKPIRQAISSQIQQLRRKHIPPRQRHVTKAGRAMHARIERIRFIKNEDEGAFKASFKPTDDGL